MTNKLIKNKDDAEMWKSMLLKSGKSHSIEIDISNDYIFSILYCRESKRDELNKYNEEIKNTAGNCKFRQEHIYLINLYEILNCFQSNPEFSDLKYEIELYGKPDRVKELFDNAGCPETDAIIRISKKSKYYSDWIEICLEYDELSHERKSTKQNDKAKREFYTHLSNKCLTYQQDKNEEIDEEKYIVHFKSLILTLLKFSCALLDDKIALSKVLYFENYDGKNIKVDTETFNIILNHMKNNIVNMEDIFFEFKPFNPLTNKKFESFNDFKKYLGDEIGIKFNGSICDYDNFASFVVDCATDMSIKLQNYKTIYRSATKKLTEAADEIIKLLSENMEKIKFLPVFIEYVVENYVWNLKDKKVVIEMIKSMPNDVDIYNIILSEITNKNPSFVWNYIVEHTDPNRIFSEVQRMPKIVKKIIDKYEADSDSDSDFDENLSDSDSDDEVPKKNQKIIVNANKKKITL